jgi:hypothetical protein
VNPVFDFKEQMAMSHGVIASMDIPALLMDKIPGAIAVRDANTAEDKQGTDKFVDHVRGVPVSVDVKSRSVDPIDTFKSDDLALETWSVMPCQRVPEGKIGWTLDTTKRTDYILWVFEPTKRYCLVPFHPLQVAFALNRQDWCKRYTRLPQRNKGYNSEGVFVPRNVVWRAIYEVSNGTASNSNALTADIGAPAR